MLAIGNVGEGDDAHTLAVEVRSTSSITYLQEQPLHWERLGAPETKLSKFSNYGIGNFVRFADLRLPRTSQVQRMSATEYCE